MKIAIGCDHIVTETKDGVVKYLREQWHEVSDEGTYDKEITHNPIFARKVGVMVLEKKVELGIVLCGTGVGISNAVSKVPGVRAALVRDVLTAKMAKQKLNANVIGVGARITGIGLIQNILDEFINTEYIETEESKRIIEKVDSLKKEYEEIKNDNFFDEFIEKWDQGFYHD